MININIDKHVKCGKAIEEYDSNTNLLQNDILLALEFQYNWIEKHNDLFEKLINKPPNLPWIHLSVSDKF
jgi:hypothetical protein